ncbi:hypothetical protein CHO01_38820 [Cellulomonas hominis]|uniref:Uncharacterized protein n=1 Tax=Cellulomonas hominis TaxID=156981 RepID=A0A511FHP7_9CELL|nr:hypothetical protein [Cellulomonas hominis]MBB5474651.1 hypothetical protein [Cellulomonas hominis]NKY06609.1 hypothetical protein [Cellulomonas hominis]GEL48766.1 hypothetical protein CHO01_38820 [Cellulomonas hominis]
MSAALTTQPPRVPAGVRSGGQFTLRVRGESSAALLEPEPAAEGGDLTLAGTSRVYDMRRQYRLREVTTRPPVIDADDTVATAVKKWGRYTAANSDLDPQDYAAARGWTPLTEAEADRLRAKAGKTVSADATAWDTSADPNAKRAVFLETRAGAKEGAWCSRYDRDDTWAVVNLARRQAAEAITADLRDFVAQHGGDPEDISANLVSQWLSMTGPEAAKDRMRNGLSAISALGDTPVLGVAPPRHPSAYGADLDAYYADRAAYQTAIIALCQDEKALREAFGATDPSRDEEKSIYAPSAWPHEHSFAEVLKQARSTAKVATTRAAAAAMVAERFGMADDLYLTQQRRSGEYRHSATVWEDKKNIPATHAAAAAGSTFHRDGMSHVEVDESVDLDDFRAVEAEWAELSRRVPHTKAPARMAFRLTGRHNAAGVYSPDRDAIAVDPRHPSSMWHEYVHHLDHTSGAGQVSLSDEFRPILRAAQQAVRADGRFATMGKSLDYWRTPTEVFSRSAELWLHWRGVRTSLNGDEHKFDDNPAYSTLYPMREQITSFFDATFGDPT